MLINKTIIMLILCSHVGAKEPRKGKDEKKEVFIVRLCMYMENLLRAHGIVSLCV